jgi:beta-lactamase class C
MISKIKHHKIYYIVTVLVLLFFIVILTRKSLSREQLSKPVDSLNGKNISLHPAVKDYLHIIEAYLDSTNNVGAAITIVHEGKTQVTKTYGVKKVGTKDSIDNNTVFRLASVSKGFAGVLACILEDEGVFSLEDKVKTYLPGLKLKDSVNTYELTIEHTLSHTSGLVPHAYDNFIEDGVPLSRIIEQLSVVDIAAPPGIIYGYQNVIFSFIDTIGNTLTGKTYPYLLTEKIFRPLKMKHASANAKIFSRRRGNYALPHARRDTSYFALPVNTGYYNIAPAAGVNASIDDMNKWLMALLGNKPQVIDSTVLNKITTPIIISPLKHRYIRSWDPIESKYYSLGWRIYIYKGLKIIYHGGYVRGYRAEIAFCPKEKVGIVFLQNSPNRLASMSIPVFFDIWISAKDSANVDFTPSPLIPDFIYFNDSTFNINGSFQMIPVSE